MTKVQQIPEEPRFLHPARMMLGFWVLLGLLDLMKNWANSAYTGREFSLSAVLPFIAFYILSWFIISYPIYQLFKKSLRFSWIKRIGVQLPASLIFSALHTLILCILFSSYIFIAHSVPQPYAEFIVDRITSRFVPPWIDSTANYWVVLVILFALSTYESFREQTLHAAKLEGLLDKAELQALRMQVQPHFLFNANNTIAMLIRTDEHEKAIEMITGLSDLLRTTLTREHEQLIPLKEELALTRNYLAIEQIRFRDRLTCTVIDNNETNMALVPSLILQPLVENAFKHGIAFCMNEASIQINSRKETGQLILSIFNTGPSLPEDFSIITGSGIGLKNVRSRLEKLFPNNSEMRIKNIEDGVQVEVELPLNTKAALK